MQLTETKLAGCYEIDFFPHPDHRGTFVKAISTSEFEKQGLETGFVECFYTISKANVLRGMHLQLPPADHAKLVYCVAGRVMDVALDLRAGSWTFGAHEIVELSAERHNGVYLPRGIAHGFCVLEGPAMMVYHVTSEHSPAFDSGIAWNSFGCQWSVDDPIISDRDSSLCLFSDFVSPFRYSEAVPEFV